MYAEAEFLTDSGLLWQMSSNLFCSLNSPSRSKLFREIKSSFIPHPSFAGMLTQHQQYYLLLQQEHNIVWAHLLQKHQVLTYAHLEEIPDPRQIHLQYWGFLRFGMLVLVRDPPSFWCQFVQCEVFGARPFSNLSLFLSSSWKIESCFPLKNLLLPSKKGNKMMGELWKAFVTSIHDEEWYASTLIVFPSCQICLTGPEVVVV